MTSVCLAYRPEDPSHGELIATVVSGEFRGSGAAWFDIERLREFAQSAGAYPIAAGHEPSLMGGYWDERGESLKQCHLSMQLSPHDRQGAIRVTVTLGTQAPRDLESDLHQTLTARFLTNYSDIDRFRLAFSSMLDDQIGSATLEGTPT